MKKIFRGFICTALLLTSGVAAFSAASAIKKKEHAVETSAADAMNAPDYTNLYSTPGQNWLSSGDPSAGQSSDYATYSTSINSSTSGYSTSTQAMTVTTGKDGSLKPYIKLQTSRTKEFRAMYVPFKMQFTVPGYVKATYTLKLTLLAQRYNADGGGADYSTELFHYGETSQTPPSYFYHQDDFATNTGRGYSQYRVAKGTANDYVSYQYTKTFTLENLSAGSAVKNVYFGVFCYMESSNYSGIFTGSITSDSCTYTFESAIAMLTNGGSTELVYTPAEAISKFNATSGQTMTLVNDLDFSSYPSNPTYTAAGTINLQSYDILLGTRLMYVRGSITFNGTTTAEIKGSAAHSVLFLDSAATVHLSGYVSVVSENTSTQTARAILIAHANADLFLDEDARIYSNYYGVQIDDGTFHCQGRIFTGSGSTTDVPYAIYIGTSETALKNVYLYGTNCRALKIHTNYLAKSRIYAQYNGTPYKSGLDVTISLGNTYSLGDIVVRSVTTSGDNKNDNRFLLSHSEYQIYTSGSNKTIQYKKYNVTYTLQNCTTNGAAFASKASNLSFTITPNEGYVLPSSITVKRGDETLTQNTHYTYNSSTGAVNVTSTYLTGAINVTVTALKIITLRFFNTNGQEIADRIVGYGSFSATLPTISEVISPAYHSILYWYLNAELTGTSYGGGYTGTVYNSYDYYAKFEQSNQDVVDEFVGVKLHFDVNVIPTSNNNDTGACRGDEGYYAVAKAAYNSLSNAQKKMFCQNAEYANGRSRFIAWANANGENLNLSTYAIIQASSRGLGTGTSDNNSLLVAIIAVTVVTSGSCLGLIIFKKRRHI